ncbi:MAG: hypothetical protein KIC56_00295 [Clostridium sp.]|nr:hypothetical protein [Clostridium sp.]MEE0768403.1 hypothetical protein [Clostridia bacterium]
MTKKIIIIPIIICISIITLIIILSNNTKVSEKVIDFCNKQEKNNFEIKISDYTNFDWESLIIYKTPTSKQELFEYVGIDYKNELDLQSGMIFVKDKKIVYEEYFETDFESPYKFIIYPYEDINSNNKIQKFSTDEAIFKVERINYKNENRYILKPTK